jgi:hypothetical protein
MVRKMVMVRASLRLIHSLPEALMVRTMVLVRASLRLIQPLYLKL